MTDDFVTDGNGWIDDFSAPAGSVGHPFVRRLTVYHHLKTKIAQEINALKKAGYDYDTVATSALQVIDESYDQARWVWRKD